MTPDLVVVLDIDDTLYLERDYVRSGFGSVGRYVETTFGATGFAEAAWGRFERGQRGNTFDDVLTSLGLDPRPDVVSDLVSQYRTHIPDITLLGDARDFLAVAAGRWPLAVLTDGAPESQRAKIQQLGLHDHSDAIVVTDELGGVEARKPALDGFRAVEAAAPGDAYVYLADNPGKDVDGCTAAGWRMIRVRRPGGLHHDVELDADRALAEVPDLTGVPALLEAIDRTHR